MIPLSMTLSYLWPGFQGHDIFWSRISEKTARLRDKVTNLLCHTIGNRMEWYLDWPLKESRGLLAIAEFLVCFSHAAINIPFLSHCIHCLMHAKWKNYRRYVYSFEMQINAYSLTLHTHTTSNSSHKLIDNERTNKYFSTTRVTSRTILGQNVVARRSLIKLSRNAPFCCPPLLADWWTYWTKLPHILSTIGTWRLDAHH